MKGRVQVALLGSRSTADCRQSCVQRAFDDFDLLLAVSVLSCVLYCELSTEGLTMIGESSVAVF